MYLKNITTRLLHYNLWANKRIVSRLATIDQDILYTPTGSSFGTIDRTIQHILSAQIYWHSIIFKGQINDFDKPERKNAVEQVMDDRPDSNYVSCVEDNRRNSGN